MDLLEGYNESIYTETFHIDDSKEWRHRYIQSPKVIDGVLTNIYKEHNFKYCECMIDGEKNEVHTGQYEDQCHAWPEEVSRIPGRITFRCPKSGYNVVILKSTEEEIKATGYFITPVEEW